MTKLAISALFALSLALNPFYPPGYPSPTVYAADVKPVEGTLSIGSRSYKLAHAVAYETKFGPEQAVTIVASDRKVAVQEIKNALKESDGSDMQLFLSQPHVMITLGSSGEVLACKMGADGNSSSVGRDSFDNELKSTNGRVTGQAKMAIRDAGIFQASFELRCDVPVGLDAAKPVAKPTGPVKPSVTGSFAGNGKQAKLAFVSARPGEPFADKPSITLIFTEKDHSREKSPEIKAGFGNFGSALILRLHEDGSIFGCEVAHSAHPKRPFSSVGSVRTAAFDVGADRIEGEIQTDGQQDTFGQTWQIDLKFVTKYTPAATPAPKSGTVAQRTPSRSPSRSIDVPGVDISKLVGDLTDESEPADDADDEKPATLGPKVHDLSLPAAASDFEYKKLVEQMTFKNTGNVQTTASELTKKLAAQGWKNDGRDLVTSKSAILKRKQGDASLTIFVKPDGKGSVVTMMTEGLDWSEKQSAE
jgi:hypothetical protein